MALDRKARGLLALKPDIAVISECAEPARLRARGAGWMESDPVWVGRNPHKGLAVFGFNGHAVRLAELLSRGAALCCAGPCRWTDGMQSAGGMGAECECGRRAQAPARSAAARPVALQGFPRPSGNRDRGRPQQQHHLGQAGLAHQSLDQGQDPRRGVRPGQRLSCGARRAARPGDDADALLARPHQGRADLSHRLCVPAVTLDRQGEGRCRYVRELVQRGAQRPCAGDRRCRLFRRACQAPRCRPPATSAGRVSAARPPAAASPADV